MLDVGRTQTLPVDEFGSSTYYSQIIDRLAPGEHTEITTPVRILYVGNFRFTVTIADVSCNELFTGPAITVHMQAVSSIGHPLVIATAAAVPLLLAALAFVLTRRRKCLRFSSPSLIHIPLARGPAIHLDSRALCGRIRFSVQSMQMSATE